MMNVAEVKKYWEDRAAQDASAQSTTQDFYLREIEYNILRERIQKYIPSSVADVGCGDGRTTTRLASHFPSIAFSGFDYSSAMLNNTRKVLLTSGATNVDFAEGDILSKSLKGSFDLIYTTRCLINIPSWDLQKLAIHHIHTSLNEGGLYLMVESFVENQEKMNQVRNQFGLSEIPIREHNFFFQKNRLIDYLKDKFEVEEDINISSSYYLVTRVIYPKICFERGEVQDYFSDHHRFAVHLPFCGEFGPIRLLCLRKRK
ncbi:MAG: class I SAM-dependent methyltransferase [Gammaproteobacteria bacterium]|nr:class I SAM-dependent methyltransferase [Gammaproteobacteria bacterium]